MSGDAGAVPLHGQCAIVTGASGSFGVAMAERLARAGAAVVLADIDGAERAAAALEAQGHQVMAHGVDVTDDASIAALTEAVMARFGRIDILINNAALASVLAPSPFEVISVELWHRVYDVNVVGAVRMCAAVSPHMRQAGRGRIVNLVSGTAYKATPGMLHYVATKGAMISVTRSLASEFAADNILVNAISPGFTVTDSMAASPELIERFSEVAIAGRLLKREATPADVANVVYFLASPDAGFVTGQIIVADGGSVFH